MVYAKSFVKKDMLSGFREMFVTKCVIVCQNWQIFANVCIFRKFKEAFFQSYIQKKGDPILTSYKSPLKIACSKPMLQ
jgi:hypothetical protein